MSYELSDEELEALKQRRLLELQRRLEEEERRRRQLIQEARRQEALRLILTPEARQRLANIRLVRPDVARLVEDQLLLLVQSGKISTPVDDETLKRILEAIYSQTRREFRIRIKEK